METAVIAAMVSMVSFTCVLRFFGTEAERDGFCSKARLTAKVMAYTPQLNALDWCWQLLDQYRIALSSVFSNRQR